jgi:hypothetical protein
MPHERRRGQSSIELVMLLAFLLLVFLAFTIIIQGRIREQRALNQLDLYIQVADKVEREMLLASRVNNGYIRSFDFPTTLNGEPYNLTLEGKDTLVVTGNYSRNEYIRFLSVNVTLVPKAVERNLSNPAIITKNETGIFIRNDCDAIETCT